MAQLVSLSRGDGLGLPVCLRLPACLSACLSASAALLGFRRPSSRYGLRTRRTLSLKSLQEPFLSLAFKNCSSILSMIIL